MILSSKPALSSADQVASALRLAIFRGEFSPGQALPQEEIASRFGVSRIPVRDAMNQLQAEGLLQILPSKGSFVANPSPEELREIYEIRALLEVEALRLAFPYHDAQSLARTERLLQQLDLETDPARLGELDLEFHAALYAPAKKQRLLALIDSLRSTSNRFYYLQLSTDDHLKKCHAAHWKILENCRLKRYRDASRYLKQHLLDAGFIVAESAAKFRAQTEQKELSVTKRRSRKTADAN